MNKSKKIIATSAVYLYSFVWLLLAVLYRTESKNIPVTRNNAI